jgi:hypothetical protein
MNRSNCYHFLTIAQFINHLNIITMKRILFSLIQNLILAAILVLFGNTTYAQLKVGTAGTASIGSYQPISSYNLNTGTAWFQSYVGMGTSAPSSGYTLKIAGLVKFDHNYSPIEVGNSGQYDRTIYPTANNTGYVGVSGKAFKSMIAYSFQPLSDKRQKENIREIKKPLDLIMSLKGVQYDLKKEFAYNDTIITDAILKDKLEKKRKDLFGFLAQDVEKVLPTVVNHDDSTDIYTMDYDRIIPILVEAVKEQNKKIEELEEKIKDSQPAPKSAEGEMTPSNSEALLGQNVPNPFNVNTTIEFYLPSTVQIANFYVYDLQGKQIKNMKVNEREHGNIVIHGSELMPGMYYYSLIADGKIIGTEKMVLTD